MKAEYDFSKAQRAKDVPHLAKLQAKASAGKSRITIFLDNAVIASFRQRAEQEGKGYQTLINEALRSSLQHTAEPITEEALRRVIREEIRAT
jgi:uncharacterized protein (DUF4415 family)